MGQENWEAAQCLPYPTPVERGNEYTLSVSFRRQTSQCRGSFSLPTLSP